MAYAIDQKARLIPVVVQGVIKDIQYNKEQSSLEYLLEYTDTDGDVQTRWFLEAQLEVVK